MNSKLATSDYDDIDVPDESPVGVAPGARRPKDLLTHEQLTTLSARSNVQGLIYLVAHFSAIGVTGWLLYLATPGWWALPALLLHAVVISYLFSPVHECCHYSAFRSFWLNEGVYWWCCLFYVMVPNWFRYLHLSHHRYTQMRGQDPEMVLSTPSNAWQWLWYVSGIPFWWRNFSRILRHATIGPDAQDPRGGKYVPRHRYARLVLEARILIAVYAALWGLAIVNGVALWLLWLWIVPRIAGEPVQRMLRVAEHTSCAENTDLLENTRTTLTNAPLRVLGWQMCYHTEHHLFPNVPFHTLPKVHEHLRDRIVHLEDRGYVLGQADIVMGLSSREQTA